MLKNKKKLPRVKRKPSGFWTLTTCKRDARRFNKRSEWHAQSAVAFAKASKNGWLDICCKHMKTLQKPRGYWTLEQCIIDAKKFRTRSEWERKSGSAYNKALKNGWLLECCAHMERLGNSHLRKLYAFEHPDKTVYVGLTYDYGRRFQQHMKRNPTLRKKYKVMGHTFRTFDKLLPIEEAAIQEQKLIDKYTREGWEILNQIKAGGLGGSTLKWTLEECRKDAKRFASKREWAEKSSGAWDAARKNKWIAQCCSQMKVRKLANGSWTREACLVDARKYKTRGEWKKKSPVAYGTAWRKSWLEYCCRHMKMVRHPKGSRTLQDCKRDAKKYKSRAEWQKLSCSFYKVAVRNHWVDECCKHMIPSRKPPGYWDNLQRCINEAKRFRSLSQWQRESSSSFKSAKRNKWKEVCLRKMRKVSSP
jgi:predicted GIY-YIG superfamily endonuclease